MQKYVPRIETATGRLQAYVLHCIIEAGRAPPSRRGDADTSLLPQFLDNHRQPPYRTLAPELRNPCFPSAEISQATDLRLPSLVEAGLTAGVSR